MTSLSDSNYAPAGEASTVVREDTIEYGFIGLHARDNEDDRALYNRALNLLSHGKYAIHEPTEMGEDNKELLPDIVQAALGAVAATPAATP